MWSPGECRGAPLLLYPLCVTVQQGDAFPAFCKAGVAGRLVLQGGAGRCLRGREEHITARHAKF